MNRSRSLHFSPWSVVLPLGAIAMAVAVFAVTQNVQRREAHVTELNRQLLSEQQTLRVLDAEWAYLTRPQRLEELMAMKVDHDVMPPTPTPVANVVPAQPEVTAPAQVTAAVEPSSGDVAPVAAAKVEPKVDAPKVEAPKIAVVKTTPAPKKIAKVDVKKAAVKTAAVTHKKVTPVSQVSMDGAWRITPKKAFVPQQRTLASAIPAHAGVAHPIVE